MKIVGQKENVSQKKQRNLVFFLRKVLRNNQNIRSFIVFKKTAHVVKEAIFIFFFPIHFSSS